MLRFILGYAGIPWEFYDHIASVSASISGKDAEFYGRGFRKGQNAYLPAYNTAFRAYFAERVRRDKALSLLDTAFAAVCVVHDRASTSGFIDTLFPATLVIPVEWTPVYGSKRELLESKNELYEKLKAASNAAKVALTALRKEFWERSNRTPLLLPLRNFTSDSLEVTLRHLQEDLKNSPPSDVIRQRSVEFSDKHPPKLDKSRQPHQWFYEDDREVMFRAPGKDLHGRSHPHTEGHPDECVLRGLRRLGAPFHHSFHYDCTRRSQPVLSGRFFDCHTSPAERRGNPHLNIAPNDFVR